jgi:hypothetical protein
VHYSLFSSSGNMLDSFDDLAEGKRVMNEMVQAEPEAHDELALVVYDADGEPTGEAVLPDDPTVPHPGLRLVAGGLGASFAAASAAVRVPVGGATRYLVGPAQLQEVGPWEPATTEAPPVRPVVVKQ